MGAGKGIKKRLRAEVDTIDSLQEDLLNLNVRKQEFVKTNKEKWQCVPWLAALADGRSGWSGRYGSAHGNLLWTLSSGAGSSSPSIDLMNALIVGGSVNEPLPVNCRALTEVTIENLDVDGIIASLLAGIKRPIWEGYDAKELKNKQYLCLVSLHDQNFPMPKIAEEAVVEAFPYFPSYKRSGVVLSIEDVEKLKF